MLKSSRAATHRSVTVCPAIVGSRSQHMQLDLSSPDICVETWKRSVKPPVSGDFCTGSVAAGVRLCLAPCPMVSVQSACVGSSEARTVHLQGLSIGSRQILRGSSQFESMSDRAGPGVGGGRQQSFAIRPPGRPNSRPCPTAPTRSLSEDEVWPCAVGLRPILVVLEDY